MNCCAEIEPSAVFFVGGGGEVGGGWGLRVYGTDQWKKKKENENK